MIIEWKNKPIPQDLSNIENNKNEIDNNKNICEKMKSIDFCVTEFLIDTEIYDYQADKQYKEAYFKVLTNEVPLWNDNDGEAVYYKDFLRGESLNDEDFLQYILKRAEYHYIDFEGDGLPELVINADGPHIFKYSPENQQVYLFYANHEKWHLLGSKKLYYYSTSSANRKIYAYEESN